MIIAYIGTAIHMQHTIIQYIPTKIYTYFYMYRDMWVHVRECHYRVCKTLQLDKIAPHFQDKYLHA